MTEIALKTPKLFISYSWSSQDHIDWVLQLATDLRDSGVEAILDRWHLKEGQDTHSFMEQMVRDEGITKVVLVCDEKYVARANERVGGVGTESQIITREIYGNVEQTKFVALALSNADSGELLLPNFLTSRLAIDFRDADAYAESLEQLVRWAFDKPLLKIPEIGEPPKFLEEQTSFSPTPLSRSVRARGQAPQGTHEFVSLWEELAAKRSDFTLELRDIDPADDVVVATIESLAPLLSQIVAIMRDRLMVSDLNDIEVEVIVRFFEKVLSNYKGGNTNWGADATKFFGQVAYVCVVAVCLRLRRFQTLFGILGSPVLAMEYEGVTAKVVSVSRLNTDIASLEHRNERLTLNRATLNADIVKSICEKLPLEFWEYLQADFYLFLYFERTDRGPYGVRWWPDSNIYATDRSGAFPLFARATNSELRKALLGPLGLDGRQNLEDFKEELNTQNYESLRWRSAFSKLPIWSLGNFDAILESYSKE